MNRKFIDGVSSFVNLSQVVFFFFLGIYEIIGVKIVLTPENKNLRLAGFSAHCFCKSIILNIIMLVRGFLILDEFTFK